MPTTASTVEPSTGAQPALPPAVFLMGPTACGKTDLAVRLAAVLPLHVISVDSALVYRGMDIGTAKPDAATLAACPHRLIDLVEPTERYSAGRFRTDALAAMATSVAQGKTPLLVGGSMLYFKALKDGLAALPAADYHVREEINLLAARNGWPALHAELARLDPRSAERIRPNDAQRIQRAMEICRLAGRPMSALLHTTRAQGLPYRLIEIALLPSDRATLHRRIDERFGAMLEAGLVEELRGLKLRHALSAELPAMRCVGYRQAWQYLEGEIDAATLYAAGAAATRQLAKRQITWLRAWNGAHGFDCLRPDLAEVVAAWLAQRLAPLPA